MNILTALTVSVLEVFENGSNIDVRFARSLPNLNISVAYTFRDLRLHAIRLNDTCNGRPTTLMRFKHVCRIEFVSYFLANREIYI